MTNRKREVMVSGAFCPVHVGHVRLLYGASRFGSVVVALNSDDWYRRKHERAPFMRWKERCEILAAFGVVGRVVRVDDLDGTVCEAIRREQPAAFANGGDRTPESCSAAEVELCRQMGVEVLWNVGGPKIASSSELLRRSAKVWAA